MHVEVSNTALEPNCDWDAYCRWFELFDRPYLTHADFKPLTKNELFHIVLRRSADGVIGDVYPYAHLGDVYPYAHPKWAERYQHEKYRYGWDGSIRTHRGVVEGLRWCLVARADHYDMHRNTDTAFIAPCYLYRLPHLMRATERLDHEQQSEPEKQPDVQLQRLLRAAYSQGRNKFKAFVSHRLLQAAEQHYAVSVTPDPVMVCVKLYDEGYYGRRYMSMSVYSEEPTGSPLHDLAGLEVDLTHEDEDREQVCAWLRLRHASIHRRNKLYRLHGIKDKLLSLVVPYGVSWTSEMPQTRYIIRFDGVPRVYSTYGNEGLEASRHANTHYELRLFPLASEAYCVNINISGRPRH
jgi:hypothetical protein